MDAFLAEVNGAAASEANLTEATLCLVIEAVARESSRRGGETMVVSPPEVLLAGSEWP